MDTGEIIKWNDERGFGFVKSRDIKFELFVHISSFGRDARRPKVGDLIKFEFVIENGEKHKITNAYYVDKFAGVVKPIKRQVKKGRNNYSLFVYALIVVVSILAYRYVVDRNDSIYPEKIDVMPSDNYKEKEEFPRYQCQTGKTHCGDMNSLEEARFYLRNCPVEGMDGDHDGNPCEQQFGH